MTGQPRERPPPPCPNCRVFRCLPQGRSREVGEPLRHLPLLPLVEFEEVGGGGAEGGGGGEGALRNIGFVCVVDGSLCACVCVACVACLCRIVVDVTLAAAPGAELVRVKVSACILSWSILPLLLNP